jgi:predicted dehydrogenase
VLLEKPAAANVAEGQRILRAAHAARVPVMVAQTLRYNSVVRVLLEHRERIGRLHALRLDQCLEPSRPAWIDEPRVAGGGMTLHTGVHSFDVIRLLSGLEVDRVSCEMASVRTAATEDNFTAVLRLSGGAALACVSGSRATASRSGGIELVGEHGQLLGEHVLNVVLELHGTTVTPLPVPPPVPTVREVLRDFAAAVTRAAPMPIPLEEGLRAVAIAEACYHSARSGQTVQVAPI